MRTPEEVTKKVGGIPHKAPCDSPTHSKRHSKRSGHKKAAKSQKSSRKASSRKRRSHGTTGMDDGHAKTVEVEATGQTASGNLSAMSSTKAPTLNNDSPSQQHRGSRCNSSLGTSRVTTKSEARASATSLVSQRDKLPAIQLNPLTEDLKPSNSKNAQLVSSDVKGSRGEDCTRPCKEARDSKADNSCRLRHLASLKNRHEPCSPSMAAYSDECYLPGIVAPSVTLDSERVQQFPKLQLSLTDIMHADLPSVEASKATTPNGLRQAQESPSTPSQRKSLFGEFGSQDATVLSKSKSFLAFWRLASSDGYSVDSPRWEKSRKQEQFVSPAGYTDESRLSKVSRTTLFVVLLVPCVVIGLVVLVVIRAHPKSPQVRRALWIDQLVEACVTVDCYSAVWELSSSVNLSEDPCKDFYGFACGRWANPSSMAANDAKRHDSYMAIQRRAYVTAVNAIFLKARRHVSPTMSEDITRHITVVYRSCLKFFHEQPVNISEAMRASGIQPSNWTEATTFKELLALALKHTLFYNVTSAINMRWVRDSSNTTSAGMVQVSPGMSMAQLMGSSSRRSLVTRALPIVVKYPTIDLVDAIESIDDDLAASTSNVCSHTRITKVHLDELDTPQTHWSSILGEYFKLTGAGEPPSKARVVNLPDVRALLNVLENSSLPELTIYLMLVPLSEFFILEGKVHHMKSASVDGSQDSVAMTCVRALELLFGGHYCLWLWTHVHTPATRRDVRRMWEQVWQETHRLIQFRREILVDHNTSVPPVENDACHPGFSSPTSHQSRELAVLPSQYSDDFVSNVILFSQKPSGGRNGCQPFLSPESLDMKWSDRETFFRLLVPDFYHDEATEVAVNYATLGFFLSKSAIRAQLPSNWNWTVYGSCLVGYVRGRLGLVPPVERWRLLVQQQWATQVALRAAALQDDRVNDSGVIKRLFLLRLQHTCCSLADRDDASDSDVLQTTCNVVTMSVPQFADAFECQNLPRLDCDS